LIEFEIVKSHDPDLIGPYTILRNKLSFGRDRHSLPLPAAEEYPSPHTHFLLLEVSPQGLALKKSPNIPFILVNGKRTSYNRKLSKNDSITFLDLTFRILRFEHQLPLSKKEILAANYALIIQNPQEFPKLPDLISALEEDAKQLTELEPKEREKTRPLHRP
jgi:hypothetical protein